MDKTTTATTLGHGDIRDFLVFFAALIELDQVGVDALPAERFHRFYDADMWRRFRCDHLDFVNRLLPSVNAMSSKHLQELARVATTYEPTVVRSVILDLFCDAATGAGAPEEFETAGQFFGWLLKGTNWMPPGKNSNGDAKSSHDAVAAQD